MTTFDERTILRNKPPPSILFNVVKGCVAFLRLTYAILYDFFFIQIFIAHSASGGSKPTDMCQLFANFFFFFYLCLSLLVSFICPLKLVSYHARACFRTAKRVI